MQKEHDIGQKLGCSLKKRKIIREGINGGKIKPLTFLSFNFERLLVLSNNSDNGLDD